MFIIAAYCFQGTINDCGFCRAEGDFSILEFSKLTLESINVLRPYFISNQCRICDCTVGGTFIWRDYHRTEYAVEDGTLYLRVSYPEPAFAPPRGAGVSKRSYERIIEQCRAEGRPVLLCAVSEAVLQGVLRIFPDARTRTDRDWSDYLYLSGDITGLAGRRFSGQRNHINRFLRERPEWSFERLTADRIPEVRAFFEKNAREDMKDSPAYVEGNSKALEVLDNLEAYGLFGGVLYVGGDVAGAAFGETVDDTLYVHTEKADTGFQGSYPMLVNQFAKMFAGEGIEFINREEDDGVEGLRTSKLSYHPAELLHKYTVEIG